MRNDTTKYKTSSRILLFYFFLLLGGLFLTNCRMNDSLESNSDSVRIRIKNQSGYTILKLGLGTGPEHRYPSTQITSYRYILPNKTTSYKLVEQNVNNYRLSAWVVKTGIAENGKPITVHGITNHTAEQFSLDKIQKGESWTFIYDFVDEELQLLNIVQD